jgi:hypothetical protein
MPFVCNEGIMGCGTAANRQELRYHAALIVEAGLTRPLLAAGVRLREMPGLPPGHEEWEYGRLVRAVIGTKAGTQGQ